MTVIDISYWQGHPDFAQVKAAGVSLVIMKCGGGEGGRLYTDSVYLANRSAARAHGIPVGSYFFNGPVAPTAAADFQWSIIDWRPGDIVALDVENSTGVTRWAPAQVLAWVNRILAHGVPASQILVYMSSSVTQLRVTPRALPGSAWLDVVATGVGLWVAQYGTNSGTPQLAPSIAGWSSWALWQYTSTATCPGIAGHVDTNQIAPGWSGNGTPIGEDEMQADERAALFAVKAALLDGRPETGMAKGALDVIYGDTRDVHDRMMAATGGQWDAFDELIKNTRAIIASLNTATLAKSVSDAVIAALPTGTTVDVSAIAAAVDASLASSFAAIPKPPTKATVTLS